MDSDSILIPSSHSTSASCRPSPGNMYLPSLSNKSPDKIYTVATYRGQPKTVSVCLTDLDMALCGHSSFYPEVQCLKKRKEKEQSND